MDERKDKKIGVKLICVLLSFSLWFYISNVENPNRTLNLSNVPVEIVNEDVLKSLNLALSPNQDFYIDLKLEGPANQIYTVSKDDFKISVDLGNYALKSGDNNIPVKVINYPEGINIRSEAVLSIKLSIEELLEKEVKVKSKVNKTFENGYSEKSFTIDPAVVKVSGPKSLIDRVDAATITGDALEINEDFEESYNLQAVDKEDTVIQGVGLNEEKANLKVTIVEGKEVDIKTRYIGALPEGISLEKEELSKSKIGISGNPSIVGNIEYLELEPINLSNISFDGEIKVNIIIPSGVTIASDESYITVNLRVKDNRIITKVIQSAPIKYTDKDEEKFIYEMPSVVNITLSGIARDLADFTLSNIKVEASLIDIKEIGEHDITWTASLISGSNIKINTATGNVKVNVSLK